jgi:general stress protein 26
MGLSSTMPSGGNAMKRNQPDAPERHEQKRRISKFLNENCIGVLATVDPNNDPHAAVIYYSSDAEDQIFFMTKTGTKKHDNLRHNNHAMFVVYEPRDQVTVQVVGEAHEITELTLSNKIFSAVLHASLVTSDSGIPPISKLKAGEYVAYALIPSEVRMAVFSRPDPGGYDKVFETLGSRELKPQLT